MCYIYSGEIMKIDNIKICTSFKDRLCGLMFKKNINPLCFPKCNSIHTFFMKKNIDVIFVNKEHKVIDIHKDVPKNKIIINKDAYYVYELPTNKYKIKLGDIIN